MAMSLNSILAAIVAAIATLFGVALIAGIRSDGIAELLPLLFFRGGELICTLAAWGSVLAGLVGVASAYASFLEPEEDEYYRGESFPMLIAPLFMVASFVGAWFAFSCVGAEEIEAPVAAPIEVAEPAAEALPAAAPDPEPIIDAEPVVEEAPEEIVEEAVEEAVEEIAPPSVPQPFATGVSWPYKLPRVIGSGQNASPEIDAMLESIFEGNATTPSIENMACNMAWVAFAGATSQEGPEARNKKRARVRSVMLTETARQWLAENEFCGETVLIGIDLGQHENVVAAPGEGGVGTAYQREVLIISRAKVYGENPSAPADAVAELEEWLSTEGNLEAFLAGREYKDPHVVFLP